LRIQGLLRLRCGLWQEASTDFYEAVRIEIKRGKPSELDEKKCELATLMVLAGDLQGYSARRRAVLEAHRTMPLRQAMIDCLLAPVPWEDLDRVCELVESSSPVDPDSVSYRFTKGLVDYRRGNYSSAAEWTQHALGNPGEDLDLIAQCHLVLAMACCELDQRQEAWAALAQAVETHQRRLSQLEFRHSKVNWPNFWITHILINEANSLVGSKLSDAGR
jgi:hypothetical protein